MITSVTVYNYYFKLLETILCTIHSMRVFVFFYEYVLLFIKPNSIENLDFTKTSVTLLGLYTVTHWYDLKVDGFLDKTLSFFNNEIPNDLKLFFRRKRKEKYLFLKRFLESTYIDTLKQ